MMQTISKTKKHTTPIISGNVELFPVELSSLMAVIVVLPIVTWWFEVVMDLVDCTSLE